MDCEAAVKLPSGAIVCKLGVGDTDAVFALHREVLESVQYGTLASHSRERLEAFLAERRAACVGAWINGELVGYTLSGGDNSDRESYLPFERLIANRGEIFSLNRGSVVNVRYRHSKVMYAMIEMRRQISKNLGQYHLKFLHAIHNEKTLQIALKCGFWLIGFEEDEYCENFVTYDGPLIGDLALGDESVVRLRDFQSIRRYIHQGSVGIGLIDLYCEEGPALVIRSCPALKELNAPDNFNSLS